MDSAETARRASPNTERTKPSYCAWVRPAKPCENVRPSLRLEPKIAGTRVKRPLAMASAGAAAGSRRRRSGQPRARGRVEQRAHRLAAQAGGWRRRSSRAPTRSRAAGPASPASGSGSCRSGSPRRRRARAPRARRAPCTRRSRPPTRPRWSHGAGRLRRPRCWRRPAHRRVLVEHAVVPRRGRGSPMALQREEPEGAEPVVDRHDDDVVGAGDQRAVVLGAGAVDESAAVDPEQHRQPRRGGPTGRRPKTLR